MENVIIKYNYDNKVFYIPIKIIGNHLSNGNTYMIGRLLRLDYKKTKVKDMVFVSKTDSIIEFRPYQILSIIDDVVDIDLIEIEHHYRNELYEVVINTYTLFDFHNYLEELDVSTDEFSGIKIKLTES